MSNTFIETDVLVIGGGVSGCFAAIRASELGSKVVLFEKAALKRCSCTGPGMDHFPSVPELGAKKAVRSYPSGGVGTPFNWLVSRDAYSRLLDFESFGVNVRAEDGEFNVVLPEMGEVGFFGPDLQIRLAGAVQGRGVNVLERMMAIDLLTKNNSVVGAVGINTRTNEFVTVSAKSVIISAGHLARAYPGYNGELFDTRACAANDGSAPAMAYRAGAEVTGMEFSMVRPDLKNEKLMSLGMFTRFADGMRGRVVNARGEVLEEKISGADFRTWRGKKLPDEILTEEREGRGPCYWDVTHVPDSQVDVFRWHVRSEFAIREQFQKDRGTWDMKKSRFLFEIRLKPSDLLGGILTDDDMATSLDGLFAAGDAACFGSLSGAAVTGHVAGETAAKYASMKGGHTGIDEKQANGIIGETLNLLNPEGVIGPVDFERKVRMVMDEYAGIYKSEGYLVRGLETLGQIREKFLPLICADNPHNLMRTLEAKNIWLCAKMHLEASLFRNESRDHPRSFIGHRRSDYPETKDGLDKPVVIKKVADEMELIWTDHYMPTTAGG